VITAREDELLLISCAATIASGMLASHDRGGMGRIFDDDRIAEESVQLALKIRQHVKAQIKREQDFRAP
jgi:hypothetical protein